MTLEQIKKELHSHFNYANAVALTPVGHYIASILFIEILNGVRYLHQNSIIHRDLKPANILVKKGVNNKYFVKIADFVFIVKHQSHTSVS
jgi:serine/threonine protein kinase